MWQNVHSRRQYLRGHVASWLDMCRVLSYNMLLMINEVNLVEKSGGEEDLVDGH